MLHMRLHNTEPRTATSKNGNLRRLGSIIVLSSLGLSSAACSTGNDTHSTLYDKQITIDAGFIYDKHHANFRHDSAREEELDGSSNSCFTAKEAVFFDPTTVYLNDQDVNGPYMGFSLSALPRNVAEACKDDADNIIWVAAAFVSYTALDRSAPVG